ncbi:MAG: type 1 glutamine amidotransferase domain-containing protein [Tissierellia bacterium]|nr:type 1 glutamine amidotransferase domain-containing protein [Tissierellia bacterium]
MKKIGILVEDLFNEQELYYPYHRLREEYEVILLGTKKDVEYTSKAGLSIKSELATKDIKAEELEGLVIPGGYSPDYMRRCEDTVKLVQELDKMKKPIAAICHGPWVLASSCDLKGKKVTSFYSIKDDVIHCGATWVDEEVVRDGHIITSRTPKDLPEFMKEFIKAIEE